MLSRRELFLVGMLILVLVTPHLGTSATPVSAQTSEKWCSGVNIVEFPGCSPGGGFETVVYNGAKAAEAELGPKVNYVWSDWQPDKMVNQFKEAMATKPDGIAVMGHPGDDAFKPVIDQAEKAGIIVTSANTTLDKIEAQYKSGGFGYVGAELYSAGHALGAEAFRRMGLNKGDRAMVWGLLSQPTRGLRTKGVVDALKEAGMTVDYLEIDAATNSDPTAGTPTFTGYVSSHPDVKLVVTDHGNATATLPTFLKAAGKKPGEIKAAGFDILTADIPAIKDGWVQLVIDQQEWLQGYLPILQICLSKQYGFSGLHIDTGAGFLSADNVDMVANLVKQGIR